MWSLFASFSEVLEHRSLIKPPLSLLRLVTSLKREQDYVFKTTSEKASSFPFTPHKHRREEQIPPLLVSIWQRYRVRRVNFCKAEVRVFSSLKPSNVFYLSDYCIFILVGWNIQRSKVARNNWYKSVKNVTLGREAAFFKYIKIQWQQWRCGRCANGDT